MCACVHVCDSFNYEGYILCITNFVSLCTVRRFGPICWQLQSMGGGGVRWVVHVLYIIHREACLVTALKQHGKWGWGKGGGVVMVVGSVLVVIKMKLRKLNDN